MKALLALFLSLALGVSGYGNQSVPEEVKPWEADANSYILERLDACLDEEGRWQVRFWIFPGTGPTGGELPEEEYGNALRELISSYDWRVTEELEYDEAAANASAAYSVSIVPSYSAIVEHAGPIRFSTYTTGLQMSVYDEETGQYGTLYFTAEGAEGLCAAVADLYPGWDAVTGCRTRIAPQATREETARAYLEATFAVLRENGHILDARVDSLELIPPEWDGQSPGSNYMTYDDTVALHFRAAFSFKPTRPELSYWQELGVGEDGWASLEFSKIALSLWEDGLYELGWFEVPMEEF